MVVHQEHADRQGRPPRSLARPGARLRRARCGPARPAAAGFPASAGQRPAGAGARARAAGCGCRRRAASTRLPSPPSIAATTRRIVWPAHAASETLRDAQDAVDVRRSPAHLEHDRLGPVLGLDQDPEVRPCR